MEINQTLMHVLTKRNCINVYTIAKKGKYIKNLAIKMFVRWDISVFM